MELATAVHPAPRITWHPLCAVLISFFVARFFYLVFACPYQVMGDEAYYWIQSQHLDWSYREKGPLLAWLIWGSCRLFGNIEWAVRLPVLLGAAAAAALAAVQAARLRGAQCGYLAAALFILIPAFQANGQIATQDGLLIPILLLLTLTGWQLAQTWESSAVSIQWAMLFGAVLGVSLLLKQSALIFLTAFPIYFALRGNIFRLQFQILRDVAIAGIVCLLVVSPMLWWESRHHWPMLEHTMAHLGFVGDRADWKPKGTRLLWVFNTLGSTIGAIGPSIVLMAMGSWRVIKVRRSNEAQMRELLWIVAASWPGILFFILLSLVKPVVPSWPLPSAVPLVVIASVLLTDEWQRLKDWYSASGANLREQKSEPKSIIKLFWSIAIGYGGISLVVLSFPTALRYLPFIGGRIEPSVLSRIAGARDIATDVSRQLNELHAKGIDVALVATSSYQRSSQLAFYLPDPHPPVTSASSLFGVRSTNFDTWEETRMDADDKLGRNILIVDPKAPAWIGYMRLDRVDPLGEDGPLFLGRGYGGKLEQRRKTP